MPQKNKPPQNQFPWEFEYFAEQTIERYEEEDEEGKCLILESLEEEMQNIRGLLEVLKSS